MSKVSVARAQLLHTQTAVFPVKLRLDWHPGICPLLFGTQAGKDRYEREKEGVVGERLSV